MTEELSVFDQVNKGFEEQGFDLTVKAVAGSEKSCWLCAKDNSYALKVPKNYIEELSKVLSNLPLTRNFGDLEQLTKLFGDDFLKLNISSFHFYPKVGFIAKDYAEFSLGEKGIFQDDIANYSVGSIKVTVSNSSSLFWLLNMRYEDDYLFDIDEYITIKLKGTSIGTLEDDLYSALYYLNFITQDDGYWDFAQVTMMFNEDDDESHYVGSTNKRKFSKPTHPTALRFFYHAEMFSGEESILYYYKVLEHFFDSAWRLCIVDLVAQASGDTNKLAELLENNQPHNEEDFLRLTLQAIQSNELWKVIKQHNFHETNIDSLTRKVYKVRNEVAHGKASNRLEIMVPSMLLTQEFLEKKALFRAIAKEALIKFGGVDNL